MAPTLRLEIDDLAQALFLVLGPNEVGTERTEISKEEVVQLEKQLWLALARTRMVNNATLSINRLPPEILARIFSFLQVPLPRTSFPPPKAFNSWFSILEVCRYWRIVALAFPRLWDHVYIRKRFDDPATMSIRHSGRLPLKVFYDLTTTNRESESHDSGEDEPSLLLSKAIDRVQELYLQLSGEAWDNQYFTTILASPAPKLERLAILGNWKDPDRAIPLLFSSCTPAIHTVIFSHISFDPLENFKNLIHLSLYSQTAPGRRPSLERFLQILRHSPNLEELVLVRAGPDEGHPVLPPGTYLTPVSLPRLRMLEIGYGHTPNVHFFLSHLIVPKQATRCIYSEQLDEFSAFLDVAIDGPYAHIRRIAITGQRSYEQMFGIKDTTLFIHGKVDFVQIRSLFSEAMLPNVQELVLSPLPEHMPTSVELHHMLRSLPLLTTLTMAGAASIHLHRLTSALGVLNDAQNNATNVINPNLRVIRVFNYSISQFYPDSYLDIFPLVLLSQARAGIGHPLQKLEIEDCQQGQVKELQGYLGATELISHKQPFGKQVFGTLLDEMWSAIRDSVPVLH